MVGQNAFKMETFPTDFEVVANKDHFPFGKAEYITIFDSNLGRIFLTDSTSATDCERLEPDTDKRNFVSCSWSYLVSSKNTKLVRK